MSTVDIRSAEIQKNVAQGIRDTIQGAKMCALNPNDKYGAYWRQKCEAYMTLLRQYQSHGIHFLNHEGNNVMIEFEEAIEALTGTVPKE